jgi:hypothetical protein
MRHRGAENEPGALVAERPHEDQAPESAPAPGEISPAGIAPANENWPIVELVAVGDGEALARALVRVLVRRALISEGVFTIGDDCSDQRRAG